MSLKSALVSWLDDHAPGAIGVARYRFHVSYRGDIVYPKITGPLFERLDSRRSSAIDVGANVGIFTRYLCGRFESVTAVEPVPYLAERLARSHPSNCRVEAVALGDSEGSVRLRIPVNAAGKEMPALSTAASGNALSFIESADMVEREVPCRRLDHVARDMRNLAFVKIDVEGFEAAVLAGATEVLTKTRPVLQVEIGRAHNPRYREVLAMFDDAGFEAFSIQKDGLYRDPERFIEQQPLSVSNDDAASPGGCWDCLFIPKERSAALSEGLVQA
ncbi:MAG TPA: FkbM family methyltransferase [Allosphingosinicella sp.]|jgi:FkbM family methyltransferase